MDMVLPCSLVVIVNKWIKKSITLANSPRYLEGLSEIYEMKVNPKRPLPRDVIPEVKKAFDDKDDKKLIRLLIEHAEVFPVKDSYIGFFKAKDEAINENPKTVKRLAKRLYSLGFNAMLREASRPIETNRQLGGSFRRWVPKMGYPIVDEDEFLSSEKGVLILDGGDRTLAKFAREKLKCKLSKGIDIVFKKNNRYYICEAKFLTTPGGEQDRGFDDASSFIHEKSGNATRIAILDGYIWLKGRKGIHEKIKRSEDNILSALLLKDFIKSLD